MKPIDTSAVSKRLKQVRDRLGHTHAEMAARLGVHFKTYSNYESGERDLPLEVVLKLVSDAGISPAWLLTGTGPQQPEDLREAVVRSASSLRKAMKSLGVKLSDSKHDQILAELIVRDVESAQPQDAVSLIRLVAA